MKFTIVNLEEVPGDLPPGTYCCHLVSATWEEWKLRVDLSPPHQAGDCLLQMVKHDEADQMAAVTAARETES